jgi:hypothetical protein
MFGQSPLTYRADDIIMPLWFVWYFVSTLHWTPFQRERLSVLLSQSVLPGWMRSMNVQLFVCRMNGYLYTYRENSINTLNNSNILSIHPHQTSSVMVHTKLFQYSSIQNIHSSHPHQTSSLIFTPNIFSNQSSTSNLLSYVICTFSVIIHTIHRWTLNDWTSNN